MVEFSLRRHLLVGVNEEVDNYSGLLLRNAPFLKSLSGLPGVLEKRHGKTARGPSWILSLTRNTAGANIQFRTESLLYPPLYK